MKIWKALRELGKQTLAAAGQQEMAKLGSLIPSAVDREDTAALRDAYHSYMSNGAMALMSSSDLGFPHVHSTPKMFYDVDDATEVSEEASWGLFRWSAFNSDDPQAVPDELEKLQERCARHVLALL